ncbi:MAG: DUF362 domain-containing protein [Propionibacteriaceae bacterium]|jgi:uncharacterized Fe-S center protein|nr:DUF362 domain-containing protein [Propionibacteriaceae bacterium]
MTDTGTPKVYFTQDISPAGLVAIFEALGRALPGRVAVKIHMGEAGNQNYLRPELVHDLVTAVDGTFVDSNTFYGGQRSDAASHLKVATEHGFTYAPVDILDADGDISIPVTGGKRQTEAVVGAHFADYDSVLSIAHFKGHGMAGFGGTFKNLAVGIASSAGKGIIHGTGFSLHGEDFLSNVVEYAKAIIDSKEDTIVYINILNNLSTDCDCDGNAPQAELDDIGILGSLDPVAIDRASVDQIYAAPADKGKHLRERIERQNGTYLLDYAEELGIGSQTYELVSLD